MFKVKSTKLRCEFTHYYIGNGSGLYLHDDGYPHPQAQWWPTRELAQAVLDKYQPPHVWEHGDVFKTIEGWIMMYHDFIYDTSEVMCIVGLCNGPSLLMEQNLKNAVFLFNIKDKL